MSNFFNELKNRNVYKAATAYVVTGWLVMQVVDVMFPALNIPDWVTSLVAALLIIDITDEFTWLRVPLLLLPLLDAGDTLVDSGNADFNDTRRREAALAGKGFGFVGMGVSGEIGRASCRERV